MHYLHRQLPKIYLIKVRLGGRGGGGGGRGGEGGEKGPVLAQYQTEITRNSPCHTI
jgi:hypothetical protein